MKPSTKSTSKRSQGRSAAKVDRPAGHSLLLMFATVVLLTLAAAPVGQWYLAWIALAPWLIAVARGTTMRGVVLRSWLAGVAYFALNLWWMLAASVSGTILLILWSALFWALAAGLIYAFGLLRPATQADGGWPPRIGCWPLQLCGWPPSGCVAISCWSFRGCRWGAHRRRLY